LNMDLLSMAVQKSSFQIGEDPVNEKLEGSDLVCYTFYLCFFLL